MRVLLLYNAPSLDASHPDYAQEAGVLESVEAADDALRGAGHVVERLGILGIDELTARLSKSPRPDVLFNLCEGFGGRGEGETEVAELLESHRLPYTGSPAAALKLARNKVATKIHLAEGEIATAPFARVQSSEPLPLDALSQLLSAGPVLVKPAAEDASLGITTSSVCVDLGQLQTQLEIMFVNFRELLVEQFIAGREFNVAVIALPKPQCLPLAEIVFADDLGSMERIVTYDAKWVDGGTADRATPVQCPAELSPELASRIREVALRAFERVGCRQYARVDLRVDSNLRVFLLEVNANPDLSPRAGLAKAIAAAGLRYPEFLISLVADVAKI